MTFSRAEPAAAGSANGFTSLLEALRVVAASASLEDAAPGLLRALGIGLDWALGCLMMVDPRDQRLHLVDAWSSGDPRHRPFIAATRSMSFAPGDGIPGQSWLEDRSLWVRDVRAEPLSMRRTVARSSGLAAAVFLPLRSRSSVIGLLELYATERRDPDADMLAQLEGFCAILGLFTQRVSDERSLREREERIRAAVEGALDAVVSIDADGKVTAWNERAEVIFGWSTSEVLGHTLSELIIPERLRQAHRAGMERYIALGTAKMIGRRLEMPAVDREGVEFPIELTVSAHVDRGGPSFSAFVRDLRQQKAAEERIASLARFPDENPLPVLRVAADGTQLYANAASRQLLGRLTGHKMPAWLHAMVAESLARGVSTEDEHVRRGRTYAISIVPVVGEGYANVYARDISERVAAERALRANEAALRDLYLVTTSAGQDFEGVIGQLLRLIKRRFGPGTVALSRFSGEGLVVEQASPVDRSLRPGKVLGLGEVFSRLVVEEGDVVAITDAAADARYSAEPAHAVHGVRAFVGAPVLVDGAIFGALTFSTRRGRSAPFPSADIDYMRLVARWVGTEIERQLDRRALAEANRELAATADQARVLAVDAQLANNAKSTFLATVSHEIRTPLNGILGMVELLQETPLGAEEAHYLDVLRASGESLLAILNELLDFSRIESGRVEMVPDVFNLPELVASVASLNKAAAAEHQTELRTVIDPAVPRNVLGDAGRIRQVLGNLVANAVKFTDSGSITVSARAGADDRVLLEVVDTGVGIAAADLERVFEPFVQIDSSPGRRFAGTGLGLAISRRLVELMGGSIELVSTPGVGSTFTVSLVLSPAGPMVETDAHPPQGGALESFGRPAARVLVVEDNPVNLEVATTILRRAGHTLAVAVDGQEALRLVDGGGLDVVLLDCQLPGMDGFAVARKIRADELANGRQRLPIIAVTANAFEEAREHCLAAGMDDYLVKPFKPGDLIAAVNRWTPAPADTLVSSSHPLPGRVESGADDLPGVLGELAGVAGREAVLSMIELFVSSSLTTADQLTAAATAGNREEVARLAHSLRGAAATVGAERLAGACRTLEQHRRAGDADTGATALRDVLDELSAARADLTRWLAALDAPVERDAGIARVGRPR